MIKITNRHDFINLDGYELQWAIESDGKAIQKGNMDFPLIPAGRSGILSLPIQNWPNDGKEYFLTLRAFTKDESPLIPRGHEVAIEQWQLPSEPIAQTIIPVLNKLTVEEKEESITLSSSTFNVSFSKQTGEIQAIQYNGKNRIQKGLQPNFWRPLTDNDIPTDHLNRCATWKNAGRNAKLQDLTIEKDSAFTTICTIYHMEEQDAQLINSYKVRADGIIQVTMHFIPGEKPLSEMPRLGMYMILPAEYDEMTWLGRGPHENYVDRKSGALIGKYQATVWEQYHPYVRAQETANHCDVRWVSLRNKQGEGLLITGEEPLSISAWNFPMEDLSYRPSQVERRHGGSLIKKDMVWLNIDHKQMGVGGDNTQVHPEYTITPHEWKYSFTIQPLNNNDDAAEKAHNIYF